LSGSVIGTSGSYQNKGNTIAKAFDGNLSTFFDAPGANGNWAGLNLGSTNNITQISYAPRVNFAGRMVGGIFQASNSSNFSSGVVNLFTVTSTPPANKLTTVNVNVSGGYQYVRYLSPNGGYGNIAELKFFGKPATATPPPTQLSGSVIGTSGSYQNDGNTVAKVFDGNLGTYFDAPGANGNWAGLNLGSAASITQISYAPRSGFSGRMVGGIFQASNSSNFSSGVVNLFTVTSTPPANKLTTVNVNASGTFRYVRYLSPNGGYGNIAEMKVFGTSSASPQTQLTGSVIGTSGSYQNDGNTIAKAVDGNLGSFFDAAGASGNWVGLDLGSATDLSQISYAPRSGFANRMVGGVFQASNSANFSSGVVNLYTITSAPPANVLTTVTVNTSGTYRYVRYLSPNGSYGNIAELELWS
jgi:hypothetical protein